jgi:hypothetical protein
MEIASTDTEQRGVCVESRAGPQPYRAARQLGALYFTDTILLYETT